MKGTTVTRSRFLVSSALAGLMATLFAFSGGGVATADQAAAVAAPASAAVLTESSCFPGVWTQVHWYVIPFWIANYRYQVNPGVNVSWRWFSAGIPPYWEGSFTTSGDIWTPPSWYTSVEFMCSSPSQVSITPL